MHLSVVGLSYKTAPLEIRERLAFAPQEVSVLLPPLRAITGVQECLLLSTCNRTEAYTVADSNPVEHVATILGSGRGLDFEQMRPWLAVAEDIDAARHLLRVGAGLESMVIGEPQILGQVRRAWELAHSAGTAGSVLTRLTQVAIASGRRVRKETGLSLRVPSVPQKALEVCRRALGSVRGRSVVVIGAGEMAALVVKAFSAAAARINVVVNRSPGTARLLAAPLGAAVATLDQIPVVLRDAEIVIVTVGAVPPVLSASSIPARTAPLHIIDLGVPRGVDPAVARLPETHVYHLDAVVSAASSAPPAIVVRDAGRIIEEALAAFGHWLQGRSAVPLIRALRLQAERVAEEELARARLTGLDPRQRDAVRAVVRTAVARILHTPTVRLKSGAGDNHLVALAAELFGLDGEHEP